MYNLTKQNSIQEKRKRDNKKKRTRKRCGHEGKTWADKRDLTKPGLMT